MIDKQFAIKITRRQWVIILLVIVLIVLTITLISRSPISPLTETLTLAMPPTSVPKVYASLPANVAYGCLTFNAQFNYTDVAGHQIDSRVLNLHSGSMTTHNVPPVSNTNADPRFYSNDRHYEAYTSATQNGWTLYIQAMDDPQAVPQAIASGVTMQLLWMPDSRHLVYLEQTTDQPFILGVVDADGRNAHSRSLLPLVGTYVYFLSASADSTRVFLDATGITPLYSVPDLTPITDIPDKVGAITWAATGHVWASQLGNDLTLVGLDEGKMTHFTLNLPAGGILMQISPSPDGRAALIEYENSPQDYYRHMDVYSIGNGRTSDIFQNEGRLRYPSLLPVWSRDGQTLTWFVDEKGLVFYLVDGHTDTIATNANNPWLSDGYSISYIATHGLTDLSVEVIDLHTGLHHVLADQLAQVVMRKSDDPSLIVFWWKKADGNGGLDAYQPDGTLTYRFRITGPIANLNAFDTPVIALSPDGHLGAIKFHATAQQERLQLAADDGSWTRTIRSGLTGLGDPLWSPDGSSFTFTQSINHQQISLQVVNASGVDVHEYTQDGLMWIDKLAWSRCN